MATHRISPALFPPPTYAHSVVVEAGERLVFTAGGVPLDKEGNLVGVNDRVRQAEQVLANLAEQLAQAGTDLEHVVNTTVYVVAEQPSDLVAVWDVVTASGLAKGPHSSTLLGVSMLGYSGQLVEIVAVAVIPD
ncbi:RidA family protein [Kutzneria sp. NPDC051319]|uniref:RidA family protein n=1 Tax=Kutzneria sp. NPDC051319 TaxID=3155047 RepID=UPI00343A53CE